uniref:Uncharacterized protein n=1 Tax=Talaromyces marneffei PM1 TaxID=1077442 RepID=A0A093Y3I5_TALMA
MPIISCLRSSIVGRWNMLLLHILVFVYALRGIDAFILFPASSVVNYTQACGLALSTNVTACGAVVAAFNPNETYNQTTLETFCTLDCNAALVKWTQDVSSSCDGVTYVDDTGAILPLSAIPSLVSYNFNQTCLVSGSDYCNIVLRNLTASISDNSTTTVVCDDCFL